MLTLRRASDRGHADHGWLSSWHTFSFADYFDPAYMGFRSLRVINEDRVAPGGGFPTHPHRDMEIFSYVLAGTLRHQDSMGNSRELRRGEVQLMSAGLGITHSEVNPSRTEGLHFLQIWIQPQQRGLRPGYTEWQPKPDASQSPRVVVISPDGRDGSAVIHQDAVVTRLLLAAGEPLDLEAAPGRGLWLQVARGELASGNDRLPAGSGVCSDGPGRHRLIAAAPTEALLFDLG